MTLAVIEMLIGAISFGSSCCEDRTHHGHHSNQVSIPAVRRGPVTVDYLSAQPAVSVEQGALPLGIGKAYACQLVATDKLDVHTLGEKRIRVKLASLLRLPGEGWPTRERSTPHADNDTDRGDSLPE